MIENKDTSAFPFVETSNPAESVSPGVTKLEFFACNAPVDIPSWFVHVAPEKNVTAQPRWETLPKETQEYIKMWLSDGAELPAELKWFSDQWRKFESEDIAYKKADWAARYFQWRRYYAEQLLLELSIAPHI